MSMIGSLLAVPQAELDELYDNPKTITSVLYGSRSDEAADLDKTWHAIHFMLTGEQYEGTPPLCNAIFGMQPIGEEDVGYGPALGTPADIVQRIAVKLSAISDPDFCARFDSDALMQADIYPQIWDDEEILNDYILPNFKALRNFYMKAAENNYAVITFIN